MATLYNHLVRIVVWSLFLIAACTDQVEQPDPCAGNTVHPESCYATSASDVMVHWLFETHSGASMATCLPGDPDVTINTRRAPGGFPVATALCGSGQTAISTRTDSLTEIIVTSVADRTYQGALDVSTMHVVSGDNLTTVVIYTD